MNVVGSLFLALLALVVIGVLVLVGRSVPDIQRYLRMRRM